MAWMMSTPWSLRSRRYLRIMLLLKRLARWLEGELDEMGEIEDEEEEEDDDDADESESGDDEDDDWLGAAELLMGLARVPRSAALRLAALALAWACCCCCCMLWWWLFKVDSRDSVAADCCGCMAASDAFKLAAACCGGSENDWERKKGRRDCDWLAAKADRNG